MAKQEKQYTKVNQLRPYATGLNLTVNVVNAKKVEPRGRTQDRFAECLVGDETGMIIFVARNKQVDLAKDGKTLVLSNAKINMFKGSMRLAVDRVGRVEVGGDSASITVNETNNLSLIDFELIAAIDEVVV